MVIKLILIFFLTYFQQEETHYFCIANTRFEK